MSNGPASLSQAATYLENYFLAEQATRPEGVLPEKTGPKKGPKGTAEELPKAAQIGQTLAGPPPRQLQPPSRPFGGWEPLPAPWSRARSRTQGLRGSPP